MPHTVISDNAGGHLMQHGKVDLAIVGADRVSRAGDAANKIGTYLKALAAQRQRRPVLGRASPSSTIDWTSPTAPTSRSRSGTPTEVTTITGRGMDGVVTTVRIVAPAAPPPIPPSTSPRPGC